MDSEVRQLLAQAQRDRAFEKILDLYETKVYRLIFSLLGNIARTQDVTQDVFLKVWQSMDVFDYRRSALSTWIYTIARNTAVTHLRAESYRQTVPLEGIPEPRAAASPASSADLRRMVERLPDELRSVVVLYYYQERSVEDLTLMLDLPSGTVKSHLFRARKMLSEMMKEVKHP